MNKDPEVIKSHGVLTVNKDFDDLKGHGNFDCK